MMPLFVICSDPPLADFKLLESILWRPGRGFYLLAGHAARLRKSALFFGFQVVSARRVRQALENAVADAGGVCALKVRLTADAAGNCSAVASPLPDAGCKTVRRPWRIAVSGESIDANSSFVRHKTTQRAIYDHARSQRPGADDVLLWNRRGEVTETTVANVVFDFGDGCRVTPAAPCGLLPGVYRESLLRAGKIREAVISLDSVLRKRPDLFLINSVRRRIPATLVL